MQLRDYVAVLRKGWWLIALTAVVTALSAIGFAKLQQPIYRSSVTLEVTGRLDYGTSLAIEKQLRQLNNRIQTANLASEVDRRYQFDIGAERLLEKVHTQAFPDTITIQIDVDDTDPARAQRIANGFAEVFAERETASQEGLPQQERRVVNVLDAAKPARLYWPQTRVFLLAGLLLGAVLGVLLAFARDYLDDSLKTPEDVERYLGLTTLGNIPRVPAGARGVRAPPGEAEAGPGPARPKPAGAEAVGARRLGRRGPRLTASRRGHRGG
ncbi:MAG TPA: Wzz/FepE/Etk N-terminal domain-containing protein [Chloroflexota bacterium]|nr:Wzz/FepE/Etk N-terminal domain-containing protein [Chloroflexota bacterium]